MDLIRRMKSLESIGINWDEKNQFPPAEFWKKYDAGEFGKPVTTLNDPAFQQWMKDVAAMPAEKQVEAVAKKLQELNPGFDGNVTGHSELVDYPHIEKGVVTSFGFSTNNVVDISPVRALSGLKALSCLGSMMRSGKLSDLSPVKGLSLETMECSNNRPLFDILPLEAMKLVTFSCCATSVSDLSPLKGMTLSRLYCADTPVSNLSPLQGMPLQNINIAATWVSDFTPLRGMPLLVLWCYSTKTSDLSPLEGIGLTEIRLTPRNIAKGMDVIRRMKSLQTIGLDWDEKNQFPAGEFWKKYDAGEFNK
jgi:hypothetical protein